MQFWKCTTRWYHCYVLYVSTSEMNNLRCRLHYVWVDQLSTALLSTRSVRILRWFWVVTHRLEGLIQPASECKHFERCISWLHNINLSLQPWFKQCHINSLVVVFIEVCSLFRNFAAGKVQCDLPVLARGMPKLSELLFFLPQLVSLTGWQPLIGFSGKVIRLII